MSSTEEAIALRARSGVEAATETLAASGVAADHRADATIQRPTVRRGLARFAGTTFGAEVGEGDVAGEPSDDGAAVREAEAALPRLALGEGARGGGERGALRLVAPLARGGMGWIRVAEQRSLGREVAVKTLAPGRGGAVAAAALLREARITGRLEHPNIVPVHDLGWAAPDGPVMVMKRVEGASWHALIHAPDHPLWGGLDAGRRLERHLEILMDVCLALHYAHSRGVVHRDVKPQNVMVGGYGEVYLLDWGVAAELDEGGQDDGALVGTAAYMAPELATPGRRATVRADVYLLGASLYEALTGRPRHGAGDVAGALAEARRAAPASYGPEVPGALAALCERACAADPADRFPDALALREAVAEHLRHRGSIATAARALATLGTLEEVVAAHRAPGGADGEDAEASTLRAHRLYSACRFGFEQALVEWPGNPEAREGLGRCLRLMVGFELDHDNARSAALILADLDEPAPELEARLAAVSAVVAEREAAEAELARLRAEARLRGRGWGRLGVTLLNGFTTAIILLVIGHGVRDGWLEPTLEGNLAFAVAASAANGLAILVFRRVLLDNRRYGRLMITVGMLAPALVLNRLLAHLVPMSFEQLLVADCAAFCAIAGTLAAVFDRAFWASFVGAVIVAAVALAHRDHALDIIGLAYAVHSVYLAWLVRPRADDDPDAAAWDEPARLR